MTPSSDLPEEDGTQPIGEWLSGTRGRPSDLSSDEVLEVLDEMRGEWPTGEASDGDPSDA